MQTYVYIIKNKVTDQKYLGAQGHKRAHPRHLLFSYFTSSKLVHELIEEHGVESFEIVDIILTHGRDHTHQVETELQIQHNVVVDPQWLNLKIQDPNFISRKSPRKGLTHNTEMKKWLKNHQETMSQEMKDRRAQLVSEARAKDWIITPPNGVQQIITNLKRFCELNSLSPTGMWRVATGKQDNHRGYRVSYC